MTFIAAVQSDAGSSRLSPPFVFCRRPQQGFAFEETNQCCCLVATSLTPSPYFCINILGDRPIGRIQQDRIFSGRCHSGSKFFFILKFLFNFFNWGGFFSAFLFFSFLLFLSYEFRVSAFSRRIEPVRLPLVELPRGHDIPFLMSYGMPVGSGNG